MGTPFGQGVKFKAPLSSFQFFSGSLFVVLFVRVMIVRLLLAMGPDVRRPDDGRGDGWDWHSVR